MTINYICNGFDKNLYNFDAVVVPVVEMNSSSTQEVCGFRLQFLNDFRQDFGKIMRKLPINSFKTNGVTVVRSEETGIYYIFVMVQFRDHMPYSMMSRRKREIYHNKNYVYCCKKMVKCINNLDVKNILIHPAFNQVEFIVNKDSDFLVNLLKTNIDRFSQKNIYIFVEDVSERDGKVAFAACHMKEGLIPKEECEKIYMESQIQKSLSYTSSLIRIAEIETKYKKKSIIEQFYEDMNNSSWFFDEYIKKYPGTDAELAQNADISPSTVSKIKSHTYKAKSKNVIIALAIALDLTIDDRERFINSAGFSYPITEHDRFIEQQLRKKRYNNVAAFNRDIVDEYPDFIIETRVSKGYKNKSDK